MFWHVSAILYHVFVIQNHVQLILQLFFYLSANFVHILPCSWTAFDIHFLVLPVVKFLPFFTMLYPFSLTRAHNSKENLLVEPCFTNFQVFAILYHSLPFFTILYHALPFFTYLLIIPKRIFWSSQVICSAISSADKVMMLSLVVAYHLLEIILIGSCRKLVKLLNYVIIVNVIIWLTGSSRPNLKSLFVYSQTWSWQQT
jgi:hypothetical protein